MDLQRWARCAQPKVPVHLHWLSLMCSAMHHARDCAADHSPVTISLSAPALLCKDKYTFCSIRGGTRLAIAQGPRPALSGQKQACLGARAGAK